VNKTVLRYEESAESPPYDPCGTDAPRRSS
jgi:hypothetical protein